MNVDLTNKPTYNEEQAAVVLALQTKLHALRINATFVALSTGPIVTTYYMKLGADVPISKILKAKEDLALAVGAPSVLVSRIGAQIAIAIPNKEKAIVSYDNCLHSIMQNTSKKLPVLLGVCTKGIPAAIDLTESPHILIAGSTGGGKSVLLSAIISGLATYKAADELKLMLVDTKQLDLTLFADLPHVDTVADTVEKTHLLLDSLMTEVRKRTELMKGIARNIYEYNIATTARESGSKLPYIITIIDELADVFGADRELAKSFDWDFTKSTRLSKKLQQLTQISRAAGIHFICATQRPSVEIITGDIKANFTTRIALRLPSGADSRTVLQEYGAEKLLGKGDMLIEGPMFDQITRLHGPFVSMEHIKNVLINCDQIRKSYAQMYLAGK